MKQKTIKVIAMKKTILIFIVLLQVVPAAAVEEIPQKKEKQPLLNIWAMAELVMPGDSRFSELYGGTQLQPRAGLSIMLFKPVHLFTAFSLNKSSAEFSAFGLDLESEFSQSQISFGVGYSTGLGRKSDFFIEAGGIIFSLKETAMEQTVEASVFGFTLQTGLIHRLGKSFLARLDLGYSLAGKELEVLTIKPGGLSLGLGLGLRF